MKYPLFNSNAQNQTESISIELLSLSKPINTKVNPFFLKCSCSNTFSLVCQIQQLKHEKNKVSNQNIKNFNMDQICMSCNLRDEVDFFVPLKKIALIFFFYFVV